MMDKQVRDFLINMIASSFSDIGYALRILLGDGNTETDSIISKVEKADDKVKELKALADKRAEEKSNINTPSDEPVSKDEEKPKARKKAEVTSEQKEKEYPRQEREDSVNDEETHEEATASTEEVPATVDKAKKEETKPEAPKHKTTIVEVRKIMTELSRKGKGKVIQDVLSNDFNVTKLSDVKEDDYDDFVTRVLYYAGETDEFVEVDNA